MSETLIKIVNNLTKNLFGKYFMFDQLTFILA